MIRAWSSSLVFLLAWISSAGAQSAGTSIEVFVGHAQSPKRGPNLIVPYDTSEIRFAIKSQGTRIRYRLEGLEHKWHEPTDDMTFMVRFLKKNGDQIVQNLFPSNGHSSGWNGSVENSTFTPRHETITVPPDAEYLTVAMSSAGPPAAIGIFAVTGITITTLPNKSNPPRAFLRDGRVPGSVAPCWIKGGIRPSMATGLHLGPSDAESPVFVIEDHDITGHADWATGIDALPKVNPGEVLDVRWQEAYSIGVGGRISASYERLPTGTYRFVVEDLTLSGDPLSTRTAIGVNVPLPYRKNPWFWVVSVGAAALIISLSARHLIRRKINRHLRHAQLIADERLRIARDLHDDFGTRLSHISLLAAYAEGSVTESEACTTFKQISTMSRELISTLSETVWMLNSNNNELESLVNFLCRTVSEMCRLSEISCRIDAMSVTENCSISHEFRHNVSLAVKESLNNALKHSGASEIKLSIRLDGTILKITVIDNGVGSPLTSTLAGHGQENIAGRMAAIGGTCLLETLEQGGFSVSLEAPIS
ncbi:MAG: histidine kinase [Verrucomicrobiota bacterium]